MPAAITGAMNRHWLAWLRPGAARGAGPAVRAWIRRGRPCVVARQEPDDDPRLRLGLCLPPATPGDAPRRISLRVRRADVARLAPPPLLDAVLRRVASRRAAGSVAACAATLRARLLPPLRRMGIAPRVYGSWLWEALAGPGYLHPDSDLDLLIAVRDPAALRRLPARLAALEADAGVRLDGEMVFPDGAGVAWRECLQPRPTLLIKRLNGVALEARGRRARVLAAAGVLRAASGRRAGMPERLAGLALTALWEELAGYPKPGLVSLYDAGGHADMDAGTLLIGLAALRPGFVAAARLGAAGADFSSLKRAGRRAETAMLRATGGINTHRGALFTLGLLAAAAARLHAQRRPPTPARLRQALQTVWGPALTGHMPAPDSHGRKVERRFGAGGALAEARAGFPGVFEAGLPALRATRRRGADRQAAAVQAFFALLARGGDSNLLHRGGVAGAARARRAARAFLKAGGVFQPGWHERAVALHRRLSGAGLSPGGGADLLAATLFVDRLAGPRCRPAPPEAPPRPPAAPAA